jgi:hypothetical protein
MFENTNYEKFISQIINSKARITFNIRYQVTEIFIAQKSGVFDKIPVLSVKKPQLKCNSEIVMLIQH